MEPAETKPVRRRRRWLIVAFVLVLVSAVSWWYWPRGDARFVGRWTVGSVYYDGTEPSSGLRQTLILRPNGRGDLFDYKDRPIRSIVWNVRGTEYREGLPTTDEATNLWLLRNLPRFFPRFRPYARTCQIESITADTVVLTAPGHEVITMTRIPE